MFSRCIVAVCLLAFYGHSTSHGDVMAQREGALHGKVFDTGYGTIVEGAKVSLRNGTLELSGVSKPDGRYSIPGILEGRYDLMVTCRGFETYRAEVTLSPGESELNIPINLGIQDLRDAPRVIEGIVTDSSGNPLGGALAVLSSPFDKNVIERFSTRADGRYCIAIPRHGQYVLYASKEGYKAVARTILADTDRTESNFALPEFHL
jgi:hypothetical protein